MQSGIKLLDEQSTNPPERIIVVINDAEVSTKNDSTINNIFTPIQDNLTSNEQIEENPEDNATCVVHTVSSPFPTFLAAMQTIQTTQDMSKDAKILMYLVTPVSFLSSFGLNKKFTFDGVDSIWQIIRTKKLPNDWPKVSGGKKIVGLAVSGLITTYVIISDSFQYYDVAIKFPKDYPLLLNISTEDFEAYAWVLGVSSSICISSLCEALPLAQYIQELLADKPEISQAQLIALSQQPAPALFLK